MVTAHLIQQCNGLDDHIISTIDVELDLGAGIRVRQAQLRLLQHTMC